MKRRCGILLHPSSMHGDYSIGSLGREAMEFVDFLYDSGFSLWQTLPFCMTDEFNSPYKSPASFSFNLFFIDLPELYSLGYITASELKAAKGKTQYWCEFERLKKERMPLLFKAAERAMADSSVSDFVEEFMKKNPRVESACRFLSNRKEYRKISDNPLSSLRFLHCEFFREWQKVKGYANSKGIEIIGDVPIYVSLDSADVSECPENFLIDSDGEPFEVAGVPPDYFSPNGQSWGNPIYNYEKMKRDGFSWWRERIRHSLSLFDGVRIDHFRGLQSYWSIPKNSESAAFGSWKQGPGEALVSEICREGKNRLLIAEDLGDIDEPVRRLLSEFSLPGMRVFEFAFLGDGDSPHLPHNYINNSVAYTATHDNNTLLGYLFECDEYTRARIFDYCGYGGSNIDEGARYIIRTLISSSAGIVMLPIQDILGYGADTRMNVPGRRDGNWGYRITREQLFSISREYYKRLNSIYSRI